MNTEDKKILAEKIADILLSMEDQMIWTPEAVSKKANQLLELVMAEKEKTIEEIKDRFESEAYELEISNKTMNVVRRFRAFLESLKSPSTIAQDYSPSEECKHEHINYNGTVVKGDVYDLCEDCGKALVEPREGREGKNEDN